MDYRCVDAALIRIGPGFPPHIEVSEFQSIPYSGDLRRRVLIACGEPGATTAEICSLHRMVGEAQVPDPSVLVSG